MLGGGYGDPVAFDVEADAAEALPDGGELVLEGGRGEVGGVQVDAPGVEALHLGFDGAGDDIPGGELEAVVVVVHEAVAEVGAEGGTGSAHGFGDEEAFELIVIEDGGVELHELHVLDFGPDCGGEGDAVGGGDAGVGGLSVDFAGSAGGEEGGAGEECAGFGVADADGGTDAVVVVGEETGDEGLFEDVNAGVVADGLADGAFDFPAGFVGVVDDAVAGVAAFATEFGVELGAEAAEPFDGTGGFGDEEADGFGVAESGSGDEGVLFVEVNAVGVADGGGDAALRPGGVCVGEGGFGDDGDASELGGVESEGETGEAAADDKEIVGVGLHGLDSVWRVFRGWAGTPVKVCWTGRMLPSGVKMRRSRQTTRALALVSSRGRRW